MIATLRNLRPETLRPSLAAWPWRRIVTAALALLLVVQTARLIWIFLAPQPALQAAPAPPSRPVDRGVLTRFDAFFRTGAPSSLEGASGDEAGQLRLFGVRAGGQGGGSAIIGLADGRQLSVGVGEAVMPGLVLQAVGPDFVTLARGQSLSRLAFSEAPAGAAPPPPPPGTEQVVTPASASAPGAAVVDPQRLMAQASLRPRLQGLGVNGFTVSSAGNASELRAAGLQAGDVILSVNGTALNSPQAIGALRGQLASAPSAEIQYERNGEMRTTTIRTRP
ncbi:type II secretion system protein N [Brevundimonas sp. UBA7534]|uniref:type II secretion system protein N n=1 Tax=Brevundimonas sp. UBA7534 TaxID=1946138 RepID=UPI0025BD257C|nr:type II secretion system protein N [Brevundimonas sp. UBA7534]